jgi:hypothetical protein
MNGKRTVYTAAAIIGGIKRLLAGRVNEILGKAEFNAPLIEFGRLRGGSAVVPVICLSACEWTEKERIIRLDAYSLTIAFALPEMAEGELCRYACTAAVELALLENPTLEGAASRTVMTGKKYKPPKDPHCGEGWEVELKIHVLVDI